MVLHGVLCNQRGNAWNDGRRRMGISPPRSARVHIAPHHFDQLCPRDSNRYAGIDHGAVLSGHFRFTLSHNCYFVELATSCHGDTLRILWDRCKSGVNS